MYLGRTAALLRARNPVVIFSNGIGDHLLNLPALRALASLFPGRLTLICNNGAREMFFSQLSLKAVFEVEMQLSHGARIFDAKSLARAVGPCDLLISLNPWHSASIDRLLELLKPAHSIGFFRTFRVNVPRDYSKHSAELAFDIPRFIDPSLKLDDFAEAPPCPPYHVSLAQRIRQVFPADQLVMTVHTDTPRVEKMWASAHFAEVLREFLRRHPEFVIFVVGGEPQDFAFASTTSPIFSCCGIPLLTSMCLVAQSDLFLGIDSCMLHAADFFRVPGVGLFGPTNSQEWGFRFGPGQHVSGEGSMENVEVSAVLRALDDLLASTQGITSSR
jgi:ADP-heptose:LPS heptosyltransferase